MGVAAIDCQLPTISQAAGPTGLQKRSKANGWQVSVLRTLNYSPVERLVVVAA
jgi:hypothetical protein